MKGFAERGVVDSDYWPNMLHLLFPMFLLTNFSAQRGRSTRCDQGFTSVFDTRYHTMEHKALSATAAISNPTPTSMPRFIYQVTIRCTSTIIFRLANPRFGALLSTMCHLPRKINIIFTFCHMLLFYGIVKSVN